jgi:hypothetical protein
MAHFITLPVTNLLQYWSLVAGGICDQAAQWPFLLKNENTLSCDIGAVVIPY